MLMNIDYKTPTFLADCQETRKCTKCEYRFKSGDSILYHYIKIHPIFILNILHAGEKALGLEHDITPDNDMVDVNSPIEFPRCKKCDSDNPEYTVVSERPHKGGIKLQCKYCGDISVKN